MRARGATLGVLLTVALGGSVMFACGSALAVTGRFPLAFSPFGAGDEPTGVAVDESSGNVFVADGEFNRVLVFGSDGGSPVGVCVGN